jgi:cardiolipin synthase
VITTSRLDGAIARRFNQQSVLGGILDPIADKLMVSTVSIALGVQGLMPASLVFVMCGRDALLVGGSFLYRLRTMKKGERFFDVDALKWEVKPTLLSKANTGLQFGSLCFSLGHAVFGLPSEAILWGLWGLTGSSTILSGAQYFFTSGLQKSSSLSRLVEHQKALLRRKDVVKKMVSEKSSAVKHRLIQRRSRIKTIAESLLRSPSRRLPK